MTTTLNITTDPANSVKWVFWSSLKVAPWPACVLPNGPESLFPLEAVPLVTGVSFSYKIFRNHDTRKMNATKCEESLWGCLHHRGEQRFGWRLNVHNATSTVTSVPYMASKDFHCLWSLRSSARALKFRKQRVAELITPFIRGAT